MSVVDTSTWKPFRVGDLFDCETTLGIPSKNNLTDGDISYVTRSAVDNGLSGYCGNLDSVNAGCCITIGAEGFVAFWQPDDFVAGNKVYALRHSGLNELSALFVCAALNVLSSEYSFSNARILDNIKQEVILFPATPDGEPDWAYMEAYMRQVMDREAVFAEHLASLTAEAVADGHVVDTSVWKAFKVGDLFEVFNGKKYVTHTRVPGPLPLISNSAVDNGIGDFIAARLDNVWSNFISVAYGSGTGIAFYHEKAAFVGETVMALVPRFDMTSNVGLFIAAVLTRYGVETYKYERKPKVDEYRSKVSIELAATPDGAPDWAYMERYMRDVMAVEALFADELDRLSRE